MIIQYVIVLDVTMGDTVEVDDDTTSRSLRSNQPLSEVEIMTDCQVESLKIKLLKL